MQRFSRYGWWFATLVPMILLAVGSWPHRDSAALSSRPMDDWDIPELVDHLHQMGVQVQLRSTRADDVIDSKAFLTSTDKKWLSLNALNKDAKRIHEWRGVLYCERGDRNATWETRLFGDRFLVVGSFLFYGDAELRHQVGAALAPFAPPSAP